MKTVAVTGGAGFIGSNFIYYLREVHPDYRIICLDKLTYAGNLQTLEPLIGKDGFVFARVDICDREAIYDLFERERPHIVVNFAAESHVDRSISDPTMFFQTNIIGTSVLMDACLKYGVERFHQVSTDEVYGDLPLDRPDLLFREDTHLNASSPYSASKASADILVHSYVRTYGLPATITRCSNNYGPYQFPEKLIPLMIHRASNGLPLPVYGDGLNVRDWLYVRDHCSAIDLVMHDGVEGEIYNVGGNNERSNVEIVRTILSSLGKGESLIEYVTDRKGHDRRYGIDATKIRKKLGWVPKVDFEKGIASTIEWYLHNTSWVASIMDGTYVGFNNRA